jgi:hypothetical protein
MKHNWPELFLKMEQYVSGEDDLTWRLIADHLGVDRCTFRDALRREPVFRDCKTPNELKAILAGQNLAELMAKKADTQNLQIAHWKAMAQGLEQELKNRQWFEQLVLRAAKILPPIKPLHLEPKGQRKNPQTAILIIGDIQRGFGIEPESVLPNGEMDDSLEILRYNPEIADARLRETFRIWLEIVSDVRQASPVDEGIVVSVGDLIDHSGLRQGHERRLADPNVITQTLGGYQALLECLIAAAEQFVRLRFVGVPGNHARAIPKWGVSQATENFDYMIYRLLEASFRESQHVQFEIPASWYHVFQMCDGQWKALVFHGDEVRNYLGFPWYGAERAVRGYQGMMWWITRQRALGLRPGEKLSVEEFRKLLAMFDLAIFGHFHTDASWVSAAVEKLAVGSLVAASEFGTRKFHEISTPSQLCAFIHPEHGLRAQSRIKLRR